MRNSTIPSKPISDKSDYKRSWPIKLDRLWKSSTSPSNKLAVKFWRIQANVKLDTFLRYMKLRMLFEGLNVGEYQMLVDSPGFFGDSIFFSALRALRNNEISPEILGERYNILYQLGYSKEQLNLNLLYTLKGVVNYKTSLEDFSVPKAKKFSGYVRNSSAVGSKRKSKTMQVEPEISDWTNAMNIDYYHFFSVGELNSGLPGGNKVTVTSPNRTKRNTNL